MSALPLNLTMKLTAVENNDTLGKGLTVPFPRGLHRIYNSLRINQLYKCVKAAKMLISALLCTYKAKSIICLLLHNAGSSRTIFVQYV